MYKKVLVPLDGSDLAVCALNHVKDLFKAGAVEEITILNVVNTHIPWAEEFSSYMDLSSARESLFVAAKKYLAGLESKLSTLGVRVKTAAVEGNSPADAIFEYAEKNGMNMIAIATHGSSGLKKLLLGGVANAILQESHIPVLLIRPEACWI